MSWVYGVDVSFDQIDPPEATLLKGAGVKVGVQCLYTGAARPAVRVANLRNLAAAGIKIAGYASITGQGGAQSMQAARADMPNDLWDSLSWVFVDVEWPTNTLAQVTEAIATLSAMGKAGAVYTSYNQWHNVMGNPPHPAGSKLWNAYWDGDADFDYPSLPFGGWPTEDVIAEQWSGGTNVPGAFADRNQFLDSAFAGTSGGTPTPVPPPPPTDAQWLKACEIVADAGRNYGRRWKLTNQQKELLRFLAQ